MNEIEERNVRATMEWASKIITKNYNRVKSLREFIRERGLIEEYWEWSKGNEKEKETPTSEAEFIKPFIVSAFTSDYEDSTYREFVVFGESNANKIFQKKVETGLYDYVRLDSAIVKDDGMIDYSREGKIKSWISEEIRHWIQHFNDDEKIVPFWVDEEDVIITDWGKTLC